MFVGSYRNHRGVTPSVSLADFIPRRNFPELFGDRVLLPESFTWFRLFQVCTFGVLRFGFDTWRLRRHYSTIASGSLPCCPLSYKSIVWARGRRVKRKKIPTSRFYVCATRYHLSVRREFLQAGEKEMPLQVLLQIPAQREQACPEQRRRD